MEEEDEQEQSLAMNLRATGAIDEKDSKGLLQPGFNHQDPQQKHHGIVANHLPLEQFVLRCCGHYHVFFLYNGMKCHIEGVKLTMWAR